MNRACEQFGFGLKAHSFLSGTSFESISPKKIVGGVARLAVILEGFLLQVGEQVRPGEWVSPERRQRPRTRLPQEQSCKQCV